MIAATNTSETDFTMATTKRKELKAKHLTRKFSMAEQKALVQLKFKLTIATTQFLSLVNEILRSYTDLPIINLFSAYLTEYNNLVFDFLLSITGTGYEPCSPIYLQTLGNHINITQIDRETYWFTFLLYVTPLNTFMH